MLLENPVLHYYAFTYFDRFSCDTLIFEDGDMHFIINYKIMLKTRQVYVYTEVIIDYGKD